MALFLRLGGWLLILHLTGSWKLARDDQVQPRKTKTERTRWGMEKKKSLSERNLTNLLLGRRIVSANGKRKRDIAKSAPRFARKGSGSAAH